MVAIRYLATDGREASALIRGHRPPVVDRDLGCSSTTWKDGKGEQVSSDSGS